VTGHTDMEYKINVPPHTELVFGSQEVFARLDNKHLYPNSYVNIYDELKLKFTLK
jgi:hypothetical protein